MATLYLVKGYRHGDAHPMLSPDVVARNAQRGFETCLMLDLNVLAYMEEVVHGRRTLQETGLDKAVEILNRTPNLVLVPGFAFGEVATHYLETRRAAFEAFLATYCPTYRDAPNAIEGGLTERIREGITPTFFGDLPEKTKIMLAPWYAMILKMRLLAIDSPHNPAERFREMLRFQCEDLDFLTLIPVELAKYVLCDVPAITPDSFRQFCAKIRRIVVKHPTLKSSNQMFRDCLNAAFDVFHYYMSCFHHAFPVGGVKQDMWILTGDEGLAFLADAIYYNPNYPPFLGATLGRVPYRDDCLYFRQCDRLVTAAVSRRSGEPRGGAMGIFTRSLGLIAACEEQGRMLFD